MRAAHQRLRTMRGPVIDEAALVDALQRGSLRGAAVDVYEEEPKIHPELIKLEEHVVLVPHIGSATHATRRRMSRLAAENLIAGLGGQRPPNLANPEAWPSKS